MLKSEIKTSKANYCQRKDTWTKAVSTDLSNAKNVAFLHGSCLATCITRNDRSFPFYHPRQF